MKGKIGKKGAVALAAAGLAVVALAVFLLVWYFGARYPQFESVAREEFAIPGLDEGACPQGLCALPENAAGYDFAVSAYFGGGPSRIYLVDEEDEAKTRSFTVLNGTEADASHFGGVACSEEYLYVASGARVGCLPLRDVFAVPENGAVAAEYFGVGLNAACLHYAQNRLYVGEFYRPGNFETDPSHRLATPSGETNPALVYVYAAGQGTGGIDASAPVAALSVRDQVQGVAVFEGGVALSCSYGLPDSGIWVYEDPFSAPPQGAFSVGGTQVPLYFLDSSNLVGTLTAPCMSEEIAVSDGRLYILFESKADKYRFFTRVRMARVQSVALSDLLAL